LIKPRTRERPSASIRTIKRIASQFSEQPVGQLPLVPPTELGDANMLVVGKARQPASGRYQLTREIYPGVFTPDRVSPVEEIVLRNWVAIVGYIVPDAVLTFRSALELQPTDGVLYVTGDATRRKVKLPGLVVEVFPGDGPLLEPILADSQLRGLYFPSEARGLLVNLSSRRGWSKWQLPPEAIEAHLTARFEEGGAPKLTALREKARHIAGKLYLPKEFGRLDSLVDTVLARVKPS